MDLKASGATFASIESLIRAIEIALLTTVDRDGHFHTRPVQTLEVRSDGTLWFFTNGHSEKAFELMRDERVSLGYADPGNRRYVAIAGTAQLMRDPQRARELWSTEQGAFFPDGPEDARLMILRVQMDRAECWLPPGRTEHLLAAFEARVTGVPAENLGENSRIP